MKKNCWEVKKCGREPNGINSRLLGVCPASTETSLNGIHDGKNAGRTCWALAGTLCGGAIQGTFAQKEKNCIQCNFYKAVRNEEGLKFKLAGNIIAKLRVDKVAIIS